MKIAQFLTKTILISLISSAMVYGSTLQTANTSETPYKLAQNTPAPNQNQTNPPQVDQGKTGNCPGPKWGKDSATAVENYSLYREYIKQNNIKLALPFWRYVYNNAPKARLTTYINGETILESLYDSAKTKEDKNAYVDTLMMLYNKRMKCFDGVGFVLGKKGSDLLKYRPDKVDEAYKYLSESISTDSSAESVVVPYYYMFASIQLMKDKKLTKEQLLDNYDKAMGRIQYHITNKGQYYDSWQQIQSTVQEMITPYISCSDLLTIYKKKYKANVTPTETLKKWLDNLNKKNCSNAPFTMQLSEDLYKRSPTAKAAYSLGDSYKAKGDYKTAIKYYMDGEKQDASEKSKKEVYFNIADCYKSLKECENARMYALKAGTGKAYILLGDVYALCGADCKDPVSGAINWVIVDQYEKAKSWTHPWLRLPISALPFIPNTIRQLKSFSSTT